MVGSAVVQVEPIRAGAGVVEAKCATGVDIQPTVSVEVADGVGLDVAQRCPGPGLRAGEDALKALIAGADFVFFGRILQFAIAAAAERGLTQLWDVLSDELSIAMAQTGMTNLQVARG